MDDTSMVEPSLDPLREHQSAHTETISIEDLTASLLRTLLTWMLLSVVLVAGVDAPLLAINKVGVVFVAFASLLFLILIPAGLLKCGRVIWAARFFVAASAIMSIYLVVVGRGMRGQGPILQLAVTIIAVVLLGRNAALLVAVACLVADLAIAILDASGRSFPVLFPGNPISVWFTIAMAFGVAAPPMYQAMHRLRKALEQLQRQMSTLRKAEEQIVYQAQLIAQSADPVVAVDNDRTITFWNKAAERTLGWSAEEVVGKPIDQPIRFSANNISRERFRAELAKDGRWEGEMVWLNRAGEARNIDAAIAILNNAAGEPIGTVGGFRDMTERRRAEAALKGSQERLRLVTETVPVGITMFDSEGRIVFANSFVANILGISQAEMLGRSVGSLGEEPKDFAGNPLLLNDHPFYRVLRTGKPVHDVNHSIVVPPGKRIYLSLNAAPILGPQGQVEGVVEAIDDVTERWDLERTYWHVQKMDSLGRLAGSIAHDFNNLLTIINGYSQLLVCSVESRETSSLESMREPLRQIDKAGQRAAELAKQLLAFSRKQVVSASPSDLNELIVDSETMLRRLLGVNVQLITKLDRGDGTVMIDSGQMQQVLMNLVVNARDAMPDGGKVTITTAKIESPANDPNRDAEQSSGSYVVLTVEDTGVGMDAETQRHIFEPFFTTKEVGRGTGLGLSTVYGIVKQNHGWIRVESQLGKGSRFSVYFPRAGELKPQDEQPVSGPSRGGETLLLVDDQPEVRAFLAECLRSYGYKVLAVGSGEEAVEFSSSYEGAIDAVVTDLVMPGMSGTVLADRLESERPGIRVLLISGYPAEQILPFGGSERALIQKPVSPDDLASAVHKLLGAHEQASHSPHVPLPMMEID